MFICQWENGNEKISYNFVKKALKHLKIHSAWHCSCEQFWLLTYETTRSNNGKVWALKFLTSCLWGKKSTEPLSFIFPSAFFEYSVSKRCFGLWLLISVYISIQGPSVTWHDPCAGPWPNIPWSTGKNFHKIQNYWRWLQTTMMMHAVGCEREQAWVLCCTNNLLLKCNLWPGWWNQFGRVLLLSTFSNVQTHLWTEIGKDPVGHYAGALRWQ